MIGLRPGVRAGFTRRVNPVSLSNGCGVVAHLSIVPIFNGVVVRSIAKSGGARERQVCVRVIALTLSFTRRYPSW